MFLSYQEIIKNVQKQSCHSLIVRCPSLRVERAVLGQWWRLAWTPSSGPKSLLMCSSCCWKPLRNQIMANIFCLHILPTMNSLTNLLIKCKLMIAFKMTKKRVQKHAQLLKHTKEVANNTGRYKMTQIFVYIFFYDFLNSFITFKHLDFIQVL